MGNFIMLANKTVWNHEDRNKTMIKEIGNKVTYILAYLDCRTDRTGYSCFSIADMITSCGFSVSSVKGKSVEQFKTILKAMNENNLITELSVDIDKAKPKEFIKCVLNKDIPKDENGNYWFFKLDTDLFIDLTEKTSKDKNGKRKSKNTLINLLNVYCYLIARMCNYSDKDLAFNGGANICFPNRDTILEDLGIKSQLLDSCLNELKELGLIMYDNIGYIKKDNKIKIANNIYATTKDDLRSGLKYSKQWYKEEGYTVLNKSVVKTVNQINGIKGAIKKKIDKGEDVTLLEERIEMLSASLKK